MCQRNSLLAIKYVWFVSREIRGFVGLLFGEILGGHRLADPLTLRMVFVWFF